MKQNCIIIGTGLTAMTVVDLIEYGYDPQDCKIVGLIDDNPDKLGKEYLGHSVIGSLSDLNNLLEKYDITHFSIGIGSLKYMLRRNEIYTKCIQSGLKPCSVIHPSVYVSDYAKISDGPVILPFVSISPMTTIGCNTLISPNVSVLENCKLGDNVVIMANSFLGGNCTIDSNVYIGPGVTIGSGVHIGANTVIGAGSTVIKDIDKNCFAFGSPISKIKQNSHYIT